MSKRILAIIIVLPLTLLIAGAAEAQNPASPGDENSQLIVRNGAIQEVAFSEISSDDLVCTAAAASQDPLRFIGSQELVDDCEDSCCGSCGCCSTHGTPGCCNFCFENCPPN